MERRPGDDAGDRTIREPGDLGWKPGRPDKQWEVINVLCLTRKVESRTNFYLRLQGGGLRLLGQIVVREARGSQVNLGFDFAGDVIVSRAETDTFKASAIPSASGGPPQ